MAHHNARLKNFFAKFFIGLYVLSSVWTFVRPSPLAYCLLLVSAVTSLLIIRSGRN